MTDHQSFSEPDLLERKLRQLQGERWIVFDLLRSENDKDGGAIMTWALMGPTFNDVLVGVHLWGRTKLGDSNHK